ncbi:multiple epidermal growth factor-like domains protein 10 [Copidosoma floridanum]|uniref:multiple epidermal growth factor-like domains protein 10 n=1 Tax=Copidosoma floridanum TaxID=29053 RepID=UPI0006C9D9F3|nr:multiple epidermal growth factor-like domains protein 10 [Copidosoma floridanum]
MKRRWTSQTGMHTLVGATFPALVVALTIAACLPTLSLGITGEHVCHRVDNYTVTSRERYTEPVEILTLVWCLQIPPRCPQTRVELRTRWRMKTEVKYKSVPVCCEGYVMQELIGNGSGNAKCVPYCKKCRSGVCTATNECTCDPGFQGQDCAYECPQGSWGQNCENECSCVHEVTCNPVNGKCECPAGWTGPRCESKCPEGQWGAGCNSVCLCGGPEARCHHESGECIEPDDAGNSGAPTDVFEASGNLLPVDYIDVIDFDKEALLPRVTEHDSGTPRVDEAVLPRGEQRGPGDGLRSTVGLSLGVVEGQPVTQRPTTPLRRSTKQPGITTTDGNQFSRKQPTDAGAAAKKSIGFDFDEARSNFRVIVSPKTEYVKNTRGDEPNGIPIDVAAMIVVGALVSLGLTSVAALMIFHIRSRLLKAALSMYNQERAVERQYAASAEKDIDTKGLDVTIGTLPRTMTRINPMYDAGSGSDSAGLAFDERPVEYANGTVTIGIRLSSNLRDLLESHYDKPAPCSHRHGGPGSSVGATALGPDGDSGVEHVYAEIPHSAPYYFDVYCCDGFTWTPDIGKCDTHTIHKPDCQGTAWCIPSDPFACGLLRRNMEVKTFVLVVVIVGLCESCSAKHTITDFAIPRNCSELYSVENPRYVPYEERYWKINWLGIGKWKTRTNYRLEKHISYQSRATCCPGYANFSASQCIPVCTKSCGPNGVCSQPELCKCDDGYWLNLDECEPKCEPGCGPHGFCSTPGQCSCVKGYRRKDHACEPICAEACINAECISPDTCSCLDGYVPLEGKQSHACSPYCSTGCANGSCHEPEVCLCDDGYRLVDNRTKCKPICSQDCGMGKCTAPETCSCLEGFVKRNATVAGSGCIVACGCENGWCNETSAACDTCKEGYELLWVNDSSACQPYCEGGCSNGRCVGPQWCECDDDYLPENDTMGNPRCTRTCGGECTHGTCDPENNTCACLHGWVGKYCDRPDAALCLIANRSNFTWLEGGWNGSRCSERCQREVNSTADCTAQPNGDVDAALNATCFMSIDSPCNVLIVQSERYEPQTDVGTIVTLTVLVAVLLLASVVALFVRRRTRRTRELLKSVQGRKNREELANSDTISL